MLKIGEPVRVRPSAAHVPAGNPVSRVLMTPESFLPVAGETLPWSAHLEQRLAHGEIEIVDEPEAVLATVEPASFVPFIDHSKE